MAQNNNVRVNLQFTADTAAARRAMDDLQTKLKNLIVSSSSMEGFGLNKGLQEASKEAAHLQAVLEKATNIDTGKLDLGKFNDSLKRSGKSLADYQKSLESLGPAGQEAFNSLASSIMSAEMPFKRTNKLLDEFWTNLKKTAGWTISSNIIHGFQGALQHAYGYAKDLNESLNNIRIVTGQSTDQMAKFAKQANEAAKSLSTTTTAYTNASLIYYQQGLSDKEVMERTEVTVKMANAAGVSAETVSDQLTSVWNNFYDGSKSLEYYADVMTALGAATASSTDEISEGLEKFSSVASTIGLSYEYATASLATITATTRESANVVGTALKTLFSRIQGLQLGETLDDGTTLNKYSEALNKVGINIFDQNNQIKEMDDILDEMGDKWGSLAQDQKMALAQTVAGVRQYTQLITLMDNWDYFQENLATATGATGALDQQADIYAESWDAASKRVQASAEGIYDALLNDEFFIKLTNLGADVLDFTKQFIDSMGGVEGLLLSIGTIASRIFSKQIAEGMRDAAYQVKYLTGFADKDAQKQKEQAAEFLASNFKSRDPNMQASNAVADAEKYRVEAQLAYIKNAKNLSEEERRITEYMFDQIEALNQQNKLQEEQVFLEKESLEAQTTREIQYTPKFTDSQQSAISPIDLFDDSYLQTSQDYGIMRGYLLDSNITQAFGDNSTITSAFNNFSALVDNNVTDVNELREAYEQLNIAIQNAGMTITTNLGTALAATGQDEDFENLRQRLVDKSTLATISGTMKSKQSFGPEDKGAIETYIKNLKSLKSISKETEKDIEQLEQALATGDWDIIGSKTKEISENLSAGGKGFVELDAIIKDEVTSMKTTLEDAGYSVNEAIDEIVSQAAPLGQKVGQVLNRSASIEGLSDNIKNQTTKVKADLADVGTAFVSLGTNIGSTIAAVEGLSNAFKDGEVNAQDFMAIANMVGQLGMLKGSLKDTKKVLVDFAKNQVSLGTAFGSTKIAAGLASGSLATLGTAAAIALPIILALGAAFLYIHNTSPDVILEKASKSAKLAAQEADRLSQAYKDVVNQLDSLEDKATTLDEMTRGTYEWRSAIMETNDEIINLLTSYGLLKEGMYEINSDGLWSITEAGKEAIENIAFERQQEAFNNKYLAQIDVNRAEINKALVDAPGGWGTITNDELITAISTGRLLAADESIKDFLRQNDAYNYHLSPEYADYEFVDTESLVTAIEQLSDVIMNNTTENIALTKELAKNTYGEKIEALDLEDSSEDALTYMLGKATDAAIEESTKGNWWHRTKKYAEDYAEEKGYNFTKNDDGSYSFWVGTKDNVVTTLDRNGLLRETADVSENDIYNSTKQLFDELLTLGNEKNLGDSLATFAYGQGGDFRGLTQNQIESIDAFSILEDLGPDLVEKLGITETDINLAKQAAESSFRQLKTEIPSFMKGAFNSPNLTLDTAKNLQNLLNESLTNNYDSFDGFNSVIKEITNSADTKTLNNFVNVLSTIDKDSLTVESLNTALIKAGIETNIFNGKLDELVKGLKKSVENLTIEQAHELNSVLKKTLESGAIDEKSLEILKQQNIGLETFFTLMGDGMYHLTGDAQKFYDLINSRVDTVENDLLIAQQEYDKISKYQKKESLSIDEQLDILSSAGIITDEERNKLQANRGKGTTAERQEANREITELFDKNSEYLLSDSFLDTLAARVETNLANLVAVNGLEGLDELDSPLKGIKDKSQIINSAVLSDLQKNDLNIDLKQYQAYRKELIKNNKALDEQSVLTNKLAIQQIKFENGVKDLTGSWESYNKIMGDSNATALQKAEILPEIDKALMQILNLDESTYAELDEQANGFAEKYWTNIQEAVASGNYEPLQKIAFEEFAQGFKTEIGTISPEFDFSKLYDLSQQLKDSDILSFDGDLKLDTSQVDEATTAIAQQFSTLIQSLYQQSGQSIEAISDLLTKMGFSIEYEYETKDFFATKDAFDEGAPTSQVQVIKGFKIIRGDSSTDGNYIPEISDGGSGPSEVKKTSKDDIIDRYKEQDDVLDNIGDALKKANREADKMYGANRIKQLDKVGKALYDEAEAIEAKKKRAEEYLKIDREALDKTAADMGIELDIDDATYDILNYTNVLEGLYDELAAAQDKAQPGNFSSKEAQDAFIESSVQPIETKIEQLKAVIAQYEETRELIEDLAEEYEAKMDEWKANNYEKLSYVLEIKLDINDMDLQEIEYDIKALGDNFYKMAEAAQLIGGDKLSAFNDQLEIQKNHVDELNNAYHEHHAITQADYVDGLQNAYDATMDLANSILDLDQEMMEYYGNTLDKANEELDKHTARLEHLTSILDHYKNLMGILGRETDYESMGVILEGSAKSLRNELDVATKNYEMLVGQTEQWADKMNSAAQDSLEYELYKKNWEAASAAMQEAQEEMLSKTEAWAEAVRAVVENSLALAAKNLERALTNGSNFNELAASLDRARSLQEEYLTDTNKIYETDKLINKAQQEIDKTTNQVAKNKLKNYIAETEQLQEQAELSNYELEIQQARLDLVMAEIALEEAQNAKSVVRLSRDSEGNYGYVYTADQDKIAAAEQEYADAQNRLYNIGLEGTYDYTEKYQQTLQEMYDTLGELQERYLNGEFESADAYRLAQEQATVYYYDKLRQYSELYNIAFTTDSNVRADTWATDFESMTNNTQDWQEAVDEYLGEVNDAFDYWEENTKEANEVVGENLDETKEKVEAVTEASDELADEVVNDVIPAIEDELDAVIDLTAAYAEQRDELIGAANAYRELADAIREKIEAETGSVDYDSIDYNEGKPESPDSNYGEGSGSGAGSSGASAEAQATAMRVAELIDKVHKGSITQDASGWTNNAKAAGYSAEEVSVARQIFTTSKTGDDGKTYNYKKALEILKAQGYDTGGYTGSWGTDGRWALLHQKELVLNQEDTSNILATVDIVRQLISAIDVQSLYSRLGNPTAFGINTNGNTNTVAQTVSIEASFPNVTDRNEIQEAFNNLLNTASQYAFRK